MQNSLYKNIISKIKKIKFFDWLLVVFSISFIVMFSFIFFRKSSYITATISVGEDSIVYSSINTSIPKTWFGNLFYKGQTEKDGLGNIQAEVLNVYSYDISANQKRVYINIKLKSVYNRATNSNTYKGVPVLVGSTIKLNLDKVYTEGLITEVQEYPTSSKNEAIKVEAQIREEDPTYPGTAGTKSYVADALNTGDAILDNNGKILIKIIDKKVMPAKITVTTSDGRAVATEDPLKKDVLLTLEILAEKQNNRYYFLHNIPILIDEKIPLNTKTISLFPIVTKIFPK